MMLLAYKGQPGSMSACENITSSMNVLFSEKASLSKLSEIRVLGIEKISIVSLEDVVVLTQFSRDVHEASARCKIISFCSSVEDSLLECLRANI